MIYKLGKANGRNLISTPQPIDVTKSMYSMGGNLRGFIGDNLGTLPYGVTITAWYKYISYPTEYNSKMIIKYGNRSTGCGFGTVYENLNRYWSFAALIESKYWASNPNYTSTTIPTDHSWRHAALIVKSGSNPLLNSTYLDGINTSFTGGTSSMNAPSGCFSIGGRDIANIDHESGTSEVLVSRVCIYDHELTSSEILDDYNMGGTSPTNNLLHYWDGTVENNLLKDRVGNWDLTISDGCSIVDETPWS